MAEFDVVTTCQMDRRYKVQAETAEQARKRMRAFLNDPELAGAFVSLADQEPTTPERIKRAEVAPREMQPEDAPKPE